jgi:hypothetical protein
LPTARAEDITETLNVPDVLTPVNVPEVLPPTCSQLPEGLHVAVQLKLPPPTLVMYKLWLGGFVLCVAENGSVLPFADETERPGMFSCT